MDIKFRGKSTKSDLWAEGSLCNAGDKKYIVYDNDFTVTKDCCGMHIVADRYLEVIPESVGQYTGLKDICQGDICTQGNNRYLIVWLDSYYQWGCKVIKSDCCFVKGCTYPLWHYSERDEELLIIGNSTDNPELMEASYEN
jgi:hypothetical protein